MLLTPYKYNSCYWAFYILHVCQILSGAVVPEQDRSLPWREWLAQDSTVGRGQACLILNLMLPSATMARLSSLAPPGWSPTCASHRVRRWRLSLGWETNKETTRRMPCPPTPQASQRFPQPRQPPCAPLPTSPFLSTESHWCWSRAGIWWPNWNWGLDKPLYMHVYMCRGLGKESEWGT